MDAKILIFAFQKQENMENDSIKEVIDSTLTETFEGDTVAMQVKNVVDTIQEKSFGTWLGDVVQEYLVPFGIKLAAAIVVLFLGIWIVRLLKKFFKGVFERHKVDVSLALFLNNLIAILLNFLLIIAIVSILGIDTSSLVALLASAGLAIGMALSGTLQNFAGGVMIMIFKPFRVGDFIEAQGQMGTVKEILIFNTIILTLDNKTVYIPNGGLATGILTNYSKQGTRRVDWTFSIAYGDDYDKAKTLIISLCNEDERIMKEPAVFVELTKLNSSSVDIVVRAWVKSEDYWGVYFSMNEKVYKNFPKEGLNIPFPQMDVHVVGSKS